jgi:hypothetical protein
MKRALPFLLALLRFGSSFSFSQSPASQQESQSPLDSYIEGIRHHQSNSAALDFGKVCGVQFVTNHRFAFSNDDAGTWKIVPNLPEAYENIGMDLVWTAEVWRSSEGIVLEEWEAALDVGGFERTFYCFDRLGKLKSVDSTNYQFPENGSAWGMHERWSLRPDGKFHTTVPFQFIGVNDKPIPTQNSMTITSLSWPVGGKSRQSG